MRILQVCSAKGLGGGERHVADLCRGLSELGHEVHLAARPDGDLVGRVSLPGVHIHPVNIRNSADIISVFQLRRLIKANRIEIVHAHLGRDYLPAAFAARGLPARLVLTRHHYYPFRVGPFYESLIGNCGLLIAVSQSVSDGISRSLPSLADRVRVIPNWLSGVEPYGREEARSVLGIAKELAIGVVGEVIPIKGQRLVAEAVAGLPEDLRTRVELLLIGRLNNREYREAVEETWAEARFLGEIDQASRLLSGLDVLVIASQGEGFSLVAIEGMLAGTALACARTAALEELVREGDTGCFFEADDPFSLNALLLNLLRQPARREELGSRARLEVMDRFSRMRIIQLIESEYQKLTNPGLPGK